MFSFKSLRQALATVFVALLFLFCLTPQSEATPQYTTTHRTNAMSDLITALGSTAYLMILSGSVPASVATADSGTVLVSIALNSTPATASSGVFTLSGVPLSGTASATGTAAHFLFCTTSSTTNCTAASSTTRIIQGTVGTSGADLNFSGGVSFTSGETITVSSFTLTANGA